MFSSRYVGGENENVAFLVNCVQRTKEGAVFRTVKLCIFVSEKRKMFYWLIAFDQRMIEQND